MENRTVEVIMLHETVLQSIISDAFTFLTIAGVIGLGVWLESEAMQWVGFVMVLVILVGRAAFGSKTKKRTPQEAADHLKSKYGVQAKS